MCAINPYQENFFRDTKKSETESINAGGKVQCKFLKYLYDFLDKGLKMSFYECIDILLKDNVCDICLNDSISINYIKSNEHLL